MLTEARSGMRLAIQDIRQNGVPPSGFVDRFGIGQPFDPAMEVYERRVALKPELHAITAILSDQIVSGTVNMLSSLPERVVQEALAYGIRGDVFDNLQGFTRDALMQTYVDTRRRSDLLPTDPLASAWQRYETLERILKGTDLVPRAESDRQIDASKTTIGRGILTGTSVMTNVLEVIPLVTGTNDPESLSRIAANSTALVTDLATPTLIDFKDIEAWLQDGRIHDSYDRYNPAHFKRRIKHGKESVVIDEEKMNSEGNSPNNFNRQGKEKGWHCPVLENLDNSSAIRKLWEWHISIAPLIYTLTKSRAVA